MGGIREYRSATASSHVLNPPAKSRSALPRAIYGVTIVLLLARSGVACFELYNTASHPLYIKQAFHALGMVHHLGALDLPAPQLCMGAG